LSCGLPYPSASQHCAYHQQKQRQQINQTYPAQYRSFSDRYDDFFAHTCIDRITYLKLAGLAAKQSGQLARPATLAIALFATIGLTGPNESILPFDLNYDGASLQHVHLPL
jgi:hypothetical protein